VISREDADRIRAELLSVLAEDAHNTQRLVERLDAITTETGVGAYSALLLSLTRLAFSEEEARRHWDAIVAHHAAMQRGLGRDAGIRVAVLDYFVNVNRSLVHPTLIDLDMDEVEREDAGVDPLTGLATDRRFRTSLQTELRRARRYEQSTAVVLIDIDDFASVNERFGTLVADRILRELAMVLGNNIRDIDVAARPGEDEMALLLPETDRNQALIVAERFRREAAAFFATRSSGGEPVELTVSAGVASFPEDATTPETLIERAAQALYHAKASGRDAVQPYHPERRRYVRFELEPGRFEVEVLAPRDGSAGRLQNLSRNGILFCSPEALDVGEEIEIRLTEPDSGGRRLRVRGRVVRLEELPDPGSPDGDRYEVGVAMDLEWAEGKNDLLDFLERAEGSRA
jgi:diguanylate cyclase (GGDEF)-like protein